MKKQKPKRVEAWAVVPEEPKWGRDFLLFYSKRGALKVGWREKDLVHLTEPDPDAARVVRAAESRSGRRQDSFCVECGPGVKVDTDGCCAACGGSAMGPWADRAAAVFRAVERYRKGMGK